ncbi:hypothetical protein IMCC12053_2003 [Celeribacter marinus]|uniref:Uncharacterized protein n=1 Tax=Celeribacter marinus TaxID=1397108 RepID=A0A0P0AAV6_9RHOB|nr:hypothetical protein IMCC12053_2003 [Celeribacter marinus]
MIPDRPDRLCHRGDRVCPRGPAGRQGECVTAQSQREP